MYGQQQRPPPQVSSAEIHLHYLRKDLDQTQATVANHATRIATLERKGQLSEKLDWKLIGIIGLTLLGLTGNITIQEIKALVLGVLG